MLVSSRLGEIVVDALTSDSAQAYASEINLTEAEYVLCRKLGVEAAKSKVESLRNSNYLLVADTERVSRVAAEIKCARALSLADCYTIATAKVTGSKALFAFRERDLQREMKKRAYDVELTFLEDFAEADGSRT